MIAKEKRKIKPDPKGRIGLSREEIQVLGREIIIISTRTRILLFSEEEYNRRAREVLSGFTGRELRQKRRVVYGHAFPKTIERCGKVCIGSG